MDVTLNRTALLDELQLLQGVVERRTTIPILANILLTASGDRLQLAATDLDLTVYCSCPAVVRQEGQTTIHGRVFFDLVRSLAGDSLDLEAATSRIDVRSGTFSSQLASLSPADYPTLPEALDGQGFAVPLGALHELIDHTVFAVSSEEGHFQYNAALLIANAKGLEMVATDGHRLAWAAVKHAGGPPPFEQQLLPRKVLSQLRRLSAASDVPLYLARSENHLAFRLGERVLLSRVLEARFPQYERVLVRDHPHTAIVKRFELATSLRRVALLASERTHGVQLQFEDDALSLMSVGFDLGKAAEVVPCHYRGPAITLLVNAHFVTDFLGAVTADDIAIGLRDSEAPLVLRLAEGQSPTTDCLYVIMPIRL